MPVPEKLLPLPPCVVMVTVPPLLPVAPLPPLIEPPSLQMTSSLLLPPPPPFPPVLPAITKMPSYDEPVPRLSV